MRHQDRRLEISRECVWCAPLPDERGGGDVQLIGFAGGEGLERRNVEDLDGSGTMSNDEDVSVRNADREELVFYSEGWLALL